MKTILNKIDELIEYPYEKSSQNYINELSALIQEKEQIVDVQNQIDFLFSKENEKSVQRFISVCFIRVVANENYEHIKSYKHQAFKLILSSLPDVCSFTGINDKTETYEKERILSDFVKERENDCKENFSFNGNISDLNSFQQTYRRTCIYKRNIIIQLFVEDLWNKSSLDKVFNKINEYYEADEDQKYDLYNSFKENLDQYIEDARELNTKYSIEFIQKPFHGIKEIINRDIERSPFFIPTQLKFYRTEKKYPLYVNTKSVFNLGIENKGKGVAQNAVVKIVDFDRSCFKINKTEIEIGIIKFENIVVEFEYEVIKTTDSIYLEIELQWSSSNQKTLKYNDLVELNAQNQSVNWESIVHMKPYNLEPIETEPELIGRNNILQRLRSMLTGQIGSSYIYGQRRVGKTSIVRTLMNSNVDKNLLIYYLEAGEWNDAQNAHKSMNNLGEKICKKIKRYDAKFNSVEIPDFEGSFNKITDFIDEVEAIDKDFKLLVILDEFDRISRNLYERGDVAQSFTLTIRSVSNRSKYGFILVGGEKLEYILSQWQEFNKFSPIRVDYFSKERDLDDFRRLIQKPVEGILEISDSAINYIYEETAGNPYFTKKICMELFSLMVSNRDVHVTGKEAKAAANIARNSANIGATDFSHFWEDGIKGKVEKEEETSLKRRKILIGIAEILRQNKTVNKDNICEQALQMNLKFQDVDKYLNEFEQRKILHSVNNEFCFVIHFFKKWLLADGAEKIVATFEEEERVMIFQQREEQIRIKSEELLHLSEKLKIYKGQEITADILRRWISQFEDVSDQRLVFKILQNFKLYNEFEIRQKMENLFNLVRKEINSNNRAIYLDSHKKKRDDIIVSYLDSSPSKGGSFFTKLFVDQNKIYSDHACVPNMLEKKISEKTNMNALLIIDDFVGSGKTLIENIDLVFNESLCKLLKEKKIIVVFGLITGYLEAKEKVEKRISKLDINASFNIIDVLNDSDKCFNNSSPIFATNIERKDAENICKNRGETLEPKYPLGYSNCQSLIAFPMNCPNNTLPIFWKKTENWIPLFERN